MLNIFLTRSAGTNTSRLAYWGNDIGAGSKPPACLKSDDVMRPVTDSKGVDDSLMTLW